METKAKAKKTESITLEVTKAQMRMLKTLLRESGIAVAELKKTTDTKKLTATTGGGLRKSVVVKGKHKPTDRPGDFLAKGGPVKFKFSTFEQLRKSAWRKGE
ncbi:MAG: hypothetical protein MUD08_13705 [Cytophagales bacterium]|jgi:hypothetical protein|nr:hypothetical protein [Cytophagales bacterium]